VGHRQVILRPEGRRVSRVGGGRDCVRDGAVVAPPGPRILNACATVLRRSCGDGVSDFWIQGEGVRAAQQSSAGGSGGRFGLTLRPRLASIQFERVVPENHMAAFL